MNVSVGRPKGSFVTTSELHRLDISKLMLRGMNCEGCSVTISVTRDYKCRNDTFDILKISI